MKALSGLNISFRFGKKGKSLSIGDGTASLDRIDSTKGYTEDNVQWVHQDINKIKQSLSESRLIELCELIVKEHYVRSAKSS